jgi:hypothetical protein
MYTTKYKKGDKIKQNCGEIWEYLGISRYQGFKAYIYSPISEADGYGRCNEEWLKSDNLPKGSIPFSQKLRGEKVCK